MVGDVINLEEGLFTTISVGAFHVLSIEVEVVHPSLQTEKQTKFGSRSDFGLVCLVLIITGFEIILFSLLIVWVPQGRVDLFSSYFGYSLCG